MQVSFRHSFRFVIVAALALFTALPLSAASKSKSDLTSQIVKSHNLLAAIMEMPEKSIPTEVLAKAKGIVFVDQFRAGFIFGIKGGEAVGMIHDGKGNWSPPSFYRVGGGSFGLQIGGERRQNILLIMSLEGTRMLTGDSGEIGVDIGVAAGPSGANADVSNLTETPLLAYTVTSGLYAGATLQGGVFSPNRKNNETYYGKPDIRALDVLEGRVKMPPAAEPLADLLKIYVKDGLEREKRKKQN